MLSPCQERSHLSAAGGVTKDVTVAEGESQAERLRQAIGARKIRATARKLSERTGRDVESHRRQLHRWLDDEPFNDDSAELLAEVLGKPKDHFKATSLLDDDEMELFASGLAQIRSGLAQLSRLQQRLARR